MTATTDHRIDPAHVVTRNSCTCGRTFHTKARYGMRVSDNNLALANARKHADAAARKYRAANPLV